MMQVSNGIDEGARAEAPRGPELTARGRKFATLNLLRNTRRFATDCPVA